MPIEFFVPTMPEIEVDPAALVTRARSILMTAHHHLFDSNPFAPAEMLIGYYVERRNQAIILLNQAVDLGNDFAHALMQRVNANSVGEQQFVTALTNSDEARVLADWLQRSLHAGAVIEPVAAAAHAEVDDVEVVETAETAEASAMRPDSPSIR